MLRTTRVGPGTIWLWGPQRSRATRLGVSGKAAQSRYGLKRRQTDQADHKFEETVQEGCPPKHADTAIANHVNLPGTGVGTFGFGGGADTVIATIAGVTVVFVGGITYIEWYKANVLNKIEAAFAAGYDPALELANERPSEPGELAMLSRYTEREEQKVVDSIMQGNESGHYYLFMGPKGGGKSTMIIDAMRSVNADGVAVCDAQPDLEVFRVRVRLGKALNYEFNEDSQTGLFQRRDSHKGGPRLDIERAMNKLEKVAIRRAKRTHRPIVLVINNVQLFNNDEGRLLLQQLQQRAESWAESHIVTMVFVSDDFWPYPVMRRIAHRMRTYPVEDLALNVTLEAFQKLRKDTLRSRGEEDDPKGLVEEAALVSGGRLAYMSRLARSRNVRQSIDRLKEGEKKWLLLNAGLIPDCDDDVMDEQKWSSCTWLLLREFVKRREALEEEAAQRKAANPDGPDDPIPIPCIPYHEVRKIMMRADFIDQLDRLNIISIDTKHNVRPDSMLTLGAAREVVNKEGFDKLLENVRDRVDDIESLRRTRELTFKGVEGASGLWWIRVDQGGGLSSDCAFLKWMNWAYSPSASTSLC